MKSRQNNLNTALAWETSSMSFHWEASHTIVAVYGGCVGLNRQEKKILYWAEIAEYDLETAEAMLETKRFLYVGFMCHQVIEKTLKAYYVSVFDDNPPYIHNLSRLASLSKLYEQMSVEQLNLLDTLEPLNIEARYPTHKEMLRDSLTQEKCELLLQEAKGLAQWIRDRF